MSIVGTELVQKVQEYLNSQDWKYSLNDGAFFLEFSLDNQLEACSMYICIISYKSNAFSVHTRTTCPITVPAEKEYSIFEFMTRANYGMIDGYFSYQSPKSRSEEGTIEYNSWIYCNDVTPSLRDVESSVDVPLQMMMDYGDALFNVLKHDSNPEEEIQRVEG